MSRLNNSNLSLTFRNWSTSGSENETENFNVIGTNEAINYVLGDNNRINRHLISQDNNDDNNMANIENGHNNDTEYYYYNSAAEMTSLNDADQLPVPLQNSVQFDNNVDIDNNDSNSSTPPHLLGRSLHVVDTSQWSSLPRILNNTDYININTNNSDFSFFKYHPEHEFCYGIPISIQKYGLINMMNDLLTYRNENYNSSDINHLDKNKKRTFKQVCLDDMNLNFLINGKNNDKFQRLTSSSFLKSGSVYSIPVDLNGLIFSLKFTSVDYNNLASSGYLQLGNIQLGFTGELVDFMENDLRFTKDKKFVIEGNIFSNLLRNKLVLSKKFEKYFDEKKRKCYTESNWKPFSMDRMGYIRSNDENFVKNSKNNKNVLNKEKILVDPVKPTKFPNGSIFHKLQISNESKFDNYKFLSKWFDMIPLNQFINTPSPPTPPNRQMKCTNNPENLLVCKDCINLIISKFLFMKLEIDIHDLFKSSDNNVSDKMVYPDLVYKHRRRFHDYAHRLISKSNNNFGTRVERELRGYTDSSGRRMRLFGNSRLNSSILFQTSDEEYETELETGIGDDNINTADNENITSNEEVITESHYQGNSPLNQHFNNNNNLGDDDSEFGVHNSDGNNYNSTNSDSDNYTSDGSASESDVNNSDDDDDDGNDGNDESSSSYNLSRASDIMAVWPVSAERFGESHPILDPDITSNDGDNSEDEYDNPYNVVFTNDRSRRVSRLLFSINMAREQHRHRRDPVSSLSLYGNDNTRMKLIMLICINRLTGELSMVPGNLDVNMWSNEQNNGEIFEDIDTFNKVFKMFNPAETKGEDHGSKKFRKWVKSKRKDDADEVKKLLMLQILANPSIINKHIQNEINKKQSDEMKTKLDMGKQNLNRNENKNKREKGKISNWKKFKPKPEFKWNNSSSGVTGDDLKEQLVGLLNENGDFGSDSNKVLKFKPGVYDKRHQQRHGSRFAFDYA